MMYPTLYDYFKDVVLKPEIHILDGEQMKSSPTQREASEALKTLWTKLGGTLVSLMLIAFPALAALPPSTHWCDVPPETLVTNAFDASSVDLSSRTTFEQSTNIVTGIMSKIRINGQQLSEDVSITTFAPFNDSWPNRGGTMDALCAAISNDSTAKRGMCFLGEIQGKDKMPDVRLGNCEVIVKICKNGVLNFEAFSTDTGTKHWDGVGFGGSFEGWRQVVTAPEVTANGTYVVKMTVSDSGQSKTYEWVSYSDPSTDLVKKTSLQGQTFDFSTTNGVYNGLKAVIEKMGGVVVNGPIGNE